MDKLTPTPWESKRRIPPTPGFPFYDVQDVIIGHIVARFENESDANLCAAAPDLLAALACWIFVAGTNGATLPDDLIAFAKRQLENEERTAVECTRAAIAKIESEVAQ